jgi:hypothetical protein
MTFLTHRESDNVEVVEDGRTTGSPMCANLWRATDLTKFESVVASTSVHAFLIHTSTSTTTAFTRPSRRTLPLLSRCLVSTSTKSSLCRFMINRPPTQKPHQKLEDCSTSFFYNFASEANSSIGRYSSGVSSYSSP